MRQAIEAHKDTLMQETLSTKLVIVDAPQGSFVESAEIDDRKLTIGLTVS